MNRGGAIRSVLAVGIVAAVAAALVGASWEFGRDRIAANERARLLESINSVLDSRHGGADVNPVLIEATDPVLLGSPDPVDVFIPMRGTTPLAAVFATIAPNGYNAPIALLVGIDFETRALSGVRTVAHRETPGLGDLIEIRKSRWIRQFDGRSLGDPADAGWAVRQDGGQFDAITGATVTPRAVIAAVHNTLIYFETHRDTIADDAIAALSEELNDD